MSFYDKNLNKHFNTFPTGNSDVPKLVDNKILKKIKKKKIKIRKNTLTNKIKDNCTNFIKNNYGIVIIFITLILLLYYRYRDVKKKRERLYNTSN